MTKKEKIILIAADFVLVVFSFFIAILIRFEGEFNANYFYGFEWLFLAVAVFCIACYHFFGLYEKLWRYAGIQELKNILLANVVAYTPPLAAAAITGGRYYSRSVIIIAALLTFFFTGGIRFLLRIINESVSYRAAGKSILIVGANDAGEAILRDILRRRASGYKPVGFIDEDSRKQKIRIHNVPVLGTIDDLQELVEEYEVEEIIIALPSPALIQKVINRCEHLKVQFKVVPPLADIIDGKLSVSSIRNVQIEDLLEREEVDLDVKEVRSFLENKRILVTGAGGSIGSELCRQVVRFNPECLVLLGRGENSIYEIALELESRTHVPLVKFIGDIRDRDRMEQLMKRYRPQIVFHTAAHKHVPLMENNVAEAITNNVLGTRTLMELSEEYGVKSFTLLSTDKAVNPTSVMGATKRLAEMYMKSFSSQKHRCRFSAVRFGNVLDSRGSVVPTFRRQIAMGGPVTVTHPDMTRYFMTIPEAVQLVIQAAAMGRDGEIFILDMGRPLKIMDLAKNMIKLSGFEPGEDIPIKILGIRPGEKLEEQLINTGEKTEKTGQDKILRVITDAVSPEEMEKITGEIKERVKTSERDELLEYLKSVVPGYRVAGESEEEGE